MGRQVLNAPYKRRLFLNVNVINYRKVRSGRTKPMQRPARSCGVSQGDRMSIADLVSTLVPKDRGVQRVARSLAYGPHARHNLDVYAPLATGTGPLPVIVFFYGGGWTDGTRHHYGFAAHALASLGYVVVVPDYRLVPEIEYPAFVEDCALSIRWVHNVIARHGGDPTRLVLMGHSAGAYNAASLALDRRWIGDAEVHKAIRGVIGLSGPYDFHPFDGPISQRVFGAAEDQPATQPIRRNCASAG